MSSRRGFGPARWRLGAAAHPEPVRTRIPLNATRLAVLRVPEVLAKYAGDIQELKIKVAEKGQSLADDSCSCSGGTRSTECTPEGDANGLHCRCLECCASSASTALSTPSSPWHPLEIWRRSALPLPRGLPARIAADESIRSRKTPLRVPHKRRRPAG